MSKFVIMETIEGFSQPVAIRDTREIALACCLQLAQVASTKAAGTCTPLEDGARFSRSEVNFNVVEVENVEVDVGPRAIAPL